MAVQQQWPTTSSSAPVTKRRAVCCMLRTCGRASSLGLLLRLRCQLGCLPLQTVGLGVEGLALALKHRAADRLRQGRGKREYMEVTGDRPSLSHTLSSASPQHVCSISTVCTTRTECLAMTDSPKLRPQSSHFTMGSSSSTTGSMEAGVGKDGEAWLLHSMSIRKHRGKPGEVPVQPGPRLCVCEAYGMRLTNKKNTICFCIFKARITVRTC